MRSCDRGRPHRVPKANPDEEIGEAGVLKAYDYELERRLWDDRE